MNKTYAFEFSELVIHPYELSKQIGYKYDEMPEPFSIYLKNALDECRMFTGFCGGFSIVSSVEFDKKKSRIIANGYEFLVGKKIYKEIEGAEELAFFVCTAGAQLSQKVSAMFAGEDPVIGYIYDIIGSALVESVGDKIMGLIEKEAIQKRKTITNRYSPGYCQWNITGQHNLFKLLNGSTCGVRLTPSSLMIPIKSISGVVGIGRHVSFKNHQCDLCNMKTCLLRKTV